MKKGGVAREIKGCRRRCLHHPAPTSAGKRREESEKETGHVHTVVCTHTRGL